MAIIKEVRVRILSTIENLDSAGLVDGDAEITESSACGYLHVFDGEYLITYVEEQDSQRITTEIRLSGDRVRVCRTGAIESDMEFCEGTSHSSVYSVGPYKFDIEINTRKIRSSIGECGGRLDLIYGMRIGGADKNARMKIELTTV